MKKCSCGCSEFIVNWHVVQTVKVDGEGNYLSTVTECDMVNHEADNDDLWTCAGCGKELPGKEFEVEE